MSQNNDHWSYEELAAFVEGRLEESANDTVLTHLEDCQHCFTIVEGIWEAGTWQNGNPDPGLSSEAARRIEQRLDHRVHRSQLAGDAVTFGSFGMLRTFLALLAPVLSVFSSSKPIDESRKGGSDV